MGGFHPPEVESKVLDLMVINNEISFTCSHFRGFISHMGETCHSIGPYQPVASPDVLVPIPQCHSAFCSFTVLSRFAHIQLKLCVRM